MKKSLIFCMSILLLTALALSSCSDHLYTDDDFDLGNTVDSSMLEGLRQTSSDEESTTDELSGSTTFYWSVSGSKFHIFEDCRYLAKTDPANLRSGTYVDAYAAGVREVCSACFKEYGDETLTFPTDTKGTVTEENPDDHPNVEDTVPADTTTVSTNDDKLIIDNNTVLYWTVGGSKYHFYRSCQSLSGSDEANIRSGKHADAVSDKKRGACSFCLKKSGLTESELPWNVGA